MSAPSCTPAPSSVKSVTPERGQLAERREGRAGPPDRDGAGHRDLGQHSPQPGRGPRGPRRPSRSPVRCWAWRPPPCSRRARRPGRRSRPSRPPRARAGADACAGRPGPGPTRHPTASRTAAPAAGRSTRPGRRPRCRATATSRRAEPSGPTTVPPRMTRVSVRQRPAPPRPAAARPRAAGTGWPCARPRRWPPAGSRPCAAGRPRPRRSRPRAPWDRGGSRWRPRPGAPPGGP